MPHHIKLLLQVHTCNMYGRHTHFVWDEMLRKITTTTCTHVHVYTHIEYTLLTKVLLNVIYCPHASDA